MNTICPLCDRELRCLNLPKQLMYYCHTAINIYYHYYSSTDKSTQNTTTHARFISNDNTYYIFSNHKESEIYLIDKDNIASETLILKLNYSIVFDKNIVNIIERIIKLGAFI